MANAGMCDCHSSYLTHIFSKLQTTVKHEWTCLYYLHITWWYHIWLQKRRNGTKTVF